MAAGLLGGKDFGLLGASQTRPAVTARHLLAYVWVEHLGKRASDLARALGECIARRSLAGAVRGLVPIMLRPP